MLTSLFFKYEDTRWGQISHVFFLMLILFAGTFFVYQWKWSPLVAIIVHTAYCFTYKYLKRKWLKREAILQTLIDEIED